MSSKNWAWEHGVREDMAPPDEVRPQRARKDRKRWCRGKVGVEHKPVLVINHNMVRGECRWWVWRLVNNNETQRHWSCIHATRCSACGKYIEYFLKPEQCPVFVEQEGGGSEAHPRDGQPGLG